MSLQVLQIEFAEAIFSTDSEVNFISPIERVDIYRNNIITNLTQTLQNTYPLIVKLVGEDFFHTAAKIYVHHYPCRSGNLHDYGEYFASFLAEYPPAESLVYLPEVARFEWACHVLYSAADHLPFDKNKLALLSKEQYAQLRFILHPASRLLTFRYPILRIYSLCQGEIEGPINLNEGGAYLLMIRRDFDIHLVTLTLAEFSFLSALQENKTLPEALAYATQSDTNFSLEEKLSQWINDKTIVDCYHDE